MLIEDLAVFFGAKAGISAFAIIGFIITLFLLWTFVPSFKKFVLLHWKVVLIFLLFVVAICFITAEVFKESQSQNINFVSTQKTGNLNIRATWNETWLSWRTEKIYNKNNSFEGDWNITIWADKEEYNTTIVTLDKEGKVIKEEVETWSPPEIMKLSEKSLLDYAYKETKQRKLIKANELSLKPLEFEEGDKYEYGSFVFNVYDDKDLKLFDNSIYVMAEEDVFANAILTNVTIETNFSHSTISDSAPYNSLVAYWNFDGDLENNKTTTHYDFTSNDNDGTGVADALVNENGAIYGGALHLDGTGDRVSTSFSQSMNFSQTDKMTFMTWVNLNSDVDALINLFSKGSSNSNQGIRFKIRPTKLFLEITNSSGDAVYNYPAISISSGEWHHVVGVYNGTALYCYLDGSDLISTDIDYITGNFLDGSYSFSLGGTTSLFNGLMDEVMIFNTSLTSAQISDIYNNQSSRFRQNGTQEIKQFNLTLETSWIKITETKEQLFGSKLYKRLGEWKQSLGYNATDFNNQGGLVSYWHFDEDVIDAMGLNNGTLSGDPQNATGVYNGSFEFDGTGDYIDVDSLNLGANTNYTFSAWINLNDCLDGAIIGDYGAEAKFLFWFDADGTCGRLGFGNNHAGGSTHYADTNFGAGWHHAIYTCNGTIGAFYLDGIADGHNAQGATFATGDFHIGEDSNGGKEFNGSIDEVMIFNRSLSADEIKELYVKGRANFSHSSYQTTDYFKVDLDSTNFLLGYKFDAGTSNFYTPLLQVIDSTIITADSSTNLTDCRELLTPNTTYTIQNAISTTGTCFTILANNITLDLNGYRITGDGGSSDYGVSLSGYDNFSVKNGEIYTFGREIYMLNSDDSLIDNVTIYDSSENNRYGIYLNNVDNSVINNSDINYAGNYREVMDYGIYMVNCDSNTISNTDASYSACESGVCDGTNLYFSGSTKNKIVNSNFSDSYDCVYLELGSVDNIFLNCSYSHSASAEIVDASSNLTRKWYYRAYTYDMSFNEIEGVNITIYNVSGNLQINFTTNNSGFTAIYEMTDYFNNGTKIYHSPYSMILRKEGYETHTETDYNVSLIQSNMKHAFKLDKEGIHGGGGGISEPPPKKVMEVIKKELKKNIWWILGIGLFLIFIFKKEPKINRQMDTLINQTEKNKPPKNSNKVKRDYEGF